MVYVFLLMVGISHGLQCWDFSSDKDPKFIEKKQCDGRVDDVCIKFL